MPAVLSSSARCSREPAIGLRIVEVTLQIAHALGEPLPGGLVEFVEMELAIVGDEFLHCVGEVRAPLLALLSARSTPTS